MSYLAASGRRARVSSGTIYAQTIVSKTRALRAVLCDGLRPAVPDRAVAPIDKETVVRTYRWILISTGVTILLVLIGDAWLDGRGSLPPEGSPSSVDARGSGLDGWLCGIERDPARRELARRPFLGFQGSGRGAPSATQGSNVHAFDRALRELYRGDLEGSVTTFREVVGRRSRDPAAWNDYAVALLERAARDERPVDLVRSLAAIQKSLVLAPDLPQARFNRALVLSRLHLRHRSLEAWRGFLHLDAESPRVDEARRHLRSAGEPNLAESWVRARSRLVTAAHRGDQAAVAAVVRQFPHLTRVEAEEKALPAWGEELLEGNGDEARRRLTLSRAVGSALHEVTGDAMVADAVRVIDGAVRAGDRGRIRRLAEGHAAFGRGLHRYREQEGDAALPSLVRAASDLRAAGSPFAAWAEFYATVCTHYADSEEALEAFRDVEGEADAGRHPMLAGFGAWMVGTVENYLNRPERALASFRLAGDRLRRTGAPETFGFVHVLFAETHQRLGDPAEAWRERLSGLQAANRGGDHRRLHATLNEAAGAALEIAPAAALEFVLELLESDRAWGNAGALVEAEALAGRTYSALGRHREARGAFQAAHEGATAIGGRGDQARHIALELALTEGEVLAELDPRQAVGRLTEALDDTSARSFHGLDHRILTARARAFERLGDAASAEEDLRRAIELYEEVREELRDERRRLAYFEGAQAAFDAMIRLQVDVRGTPGAAFTYAERARARLLLDLVQASAPLPLPGPRTVEEVQAGLPAEVVLVEYAVLPERLLVWVLDRGAVRMTSIAVGEEELAGHLQALLLAIERRAPEPEIRRVAGDLHDLLLAPALQGVPSEAPLVLVPDRLLVRVPFGALWDRARGRYVVEQREVALAPSATLFLAASERRKTFQGERTVLAVGDPAFDRLAFPSLPRLPDAAAEAAEVASLYPGSDLLRFGEATQASFVEGAKSHRIIHFSGHALLDPASPWRNRLILTPGDRDGSLDAAEIARLRLPETEIVVLSACRTLPGDTDRESLNGLAAAFFAAGPPVVVSSLWEVEDRTTRRLMVELHSALREGSAPAAALREAQLRLLRDRDPSVSSPAAWGAFEAFGGAITD